MPIGMGVKGLSLSAFFGGVIATFVGFFIGFGISQSYPDLINPATYFPLTAGLGVIAGLVVPLVITWRDHRFEHIVVVPRKWRRSLDRASIALQIQEWGRLEHQQFHLSEMRSGFDAFEEYAEAYQEAIDYELHILKSSIATITTDIDRAVADDLFTRGRP